MAKKIDMTGWVMKEHGVPDSKWTVIKEVQNYAKNNGLKDTSAYWLCKCECGTEKVINGCSLRAGKTKQSLPGTIVPGSLLYHLADFCATGYNEYHDMHIMHYMPGWYGDRNPAVSEQLY